MYRMFITLFVASLFMVGCGQSTPKAPEAAIQKPGASAKEEMKKESAEAVEDVEESEEHHADHHDNADDDGDDEGVEATELKNHELGPYNVRAVRMGDVDNGHVNFYITGDGIKAVRTWVGDEAATDVLVTKANWEDDHYCAHLELPETVPADATLWYEIESEDGSIQKSSALLGAQ